MNLINNLDVQLSKHFSLRELVVTSSRTIDNRPTQEIVDRLQVLCEQFLEPVRNQFGAIRVNSGYRCPELNKSIGGSLNSSHMFGCAADIFPLVKGVGIKDIILWVRDKSGLWFDQIIDEASSTAIWCHIGMPVPRKQILLFRNGSYTKFI